MIWDLGFGMLDLGSRYRRGISSLRIGTFRIQKSKILNLKSAILLWLLALSSQLLAPPSAVAADALPMLNAQRAYFHLPPLQFDPVLSAAAERDCQTRASQGRTGHLRTGARPGRAEGVGYRRGSDPLGKRFFACYQSTRKYRYAGAAVVVRNGRTFYQLKLR